MIKLTSRLICFILSVGIHLFPTQLLSMAKVVNHENHENNKENNENQSSSKHPESFIHDKKQVAEKTIGPNEPSSSVLAKKVQWTEHKHKHFPPKHLPWEKIISSTKSGPAKYRPNSPIEEIEREVWEKGTCCDNYKIMDFNDIIGASKGEETSYVKVEYDSNTNTIHGHPITHREYENILKKCD